MKSCWILPLVALSGLNLTWGENQAVPPALVANGSTLTLNGEPFRIFSGAIHYFRVPAQYWHDRLLKLKACGLNTVETYVPCGYSMTDQGSKGFEVLNKSQVMFEELARADGGNVGLLGDLDIVSFLRTAQSLGLYVILRPGPYICAEWDWGGHPAWLLKDPNMKVRTLYTGYTQPVEKYLSKLLPMVTPFQFTSNKGPIIMVQVENEYGAYGDDGSYISWLRDLLIQKGITELLFTSDGGFALPEGTIPGLFTVVNFQGQPQHNLDALKAFQPNRPLMVGEYWSGWFDHWGDKHHTWYNPVPPPNSSLQVYTETLQLILDNNASFNLYMFHGGTSFGFMNGANRVYENGTPAYHPDVTSYDYAGPLSESGWLTAKYYATQQLMRKYNPHFPTGTEELVAKWKKEETEVTELATSPRPFSPTQHLTLTNALRSLPSTNLNVLSTMEALDQNHGFIVYKAYVPGTQGTLNFTVTVADRAQVILRGQVVKTLYSHGMEAATWTFSLPTFSGDSVEDLLIIVENMGRVNYDMTPNTLDNERKGMTGVVTFNGNLINTWTTYKLPLDPPQLKELAASTYWEPTTQSHSQTEPTFYQLPVPSSPFITDSFLDPRAWGKGSAFVNTFNLGRYWPTKGPQQTLYLPAPLLSSSSPNLITLFELEKMGDAVALVRYPNLG